MTRKPAVAFLVRGIFLDYLLFHLKDHLTSLPWNKKKIPTYTDCVSVFWFRSEWHQGKLMFSLLSDMCYFYFKQLQHSHDLACVGAEDKQRSKRVCCMR